MTRTTGTLHEDRYTFIIVSRSLLLRIRNISDKTFRENQKTTIYSIIFPNVVPFMR